MPPTNPQLAFPFMPQSGHVAPLADGDTILGTATMLDDVSDQLASEAELRTQIEAQRRARATAEEALRAKDEFLSTLSHEIRTPLNAVLGWTRILLGREQLDRDLVDRALRVIERNATAQAKMIDDMLDMARIVAGKLRLEVHEVDLAGVVLAALDVVAPSANAKRITVRTALDAGMPRVLGDADRLQQVVWNLLSNALKFTAAGGIVDVRIGMDGRFARVEVSDTGQGISPEFLPYVFDRFRQNDSSSTRRHGGLGLGLALVRELVELHGGLVRAASPGRNQGSTFTIELPVVLVPEVGQARSSADAVTSGTLPSLVGMRVLVVEDEADARELTATALQHFGAQVTTMSSCVDALLSLRAAAPHQLPDVVVSDIGMPGQDGYEFIRQVRMLATRAARIPAVAVTGYATPEDIERTMAAGFQLHLSKPMDPSELAAAIARLARRADRPADTGRD
jgi:signal transduction histidine kinase/CheY-like chemotaxis protein